MRKSIALTVALMFTGGRPKGGSFFQGYIVTIEIWLNVSKSLQKNRATSPSISGKSVAHAKAGITLLQDKGFENQTQP